MRIGIGIVIGKPGIRIGIGKRIAQIRVLGVLKDSTELN